MIYVFKSKPLMTSEQYTDYDNFRREHGIQKYIDDDDVSYRCANRKFKVKYPDYDGDPEMDYLLDRLDRLDKTDVC